MKTILFNFAEMGNKDKAAKEAIKHFEKRRAMVKQVDVMPGTKKVNGMAYRELSLTFADSQQITFRVKESGDIYQVLMNGSLIPIKNQDDHAAAIIEIANKMEDNRKKFQAKQAKEVTKLPPSIKTAAPKIIEVLTQKRDELTVAVTEAEAVLAELKAA